MTNGDFYYLWFYNDSGQPGQACVYLDVSGVTTNMGKNPTLLAWMVAPANDGVLVRFQWKLDNVYLWVQYTPNRAQQVKAGSPGTSVPLTMTQYGLDFGTVTTGTAGSLAIQQDSTIPSGTSSLAGIGLHGAGTYAFPIAPSQRMELTPVDQPPYRITFGNLGLSVNDPINPASFQIQPTSIVYPANVTEMTAVLDNQNQWTVTQGPPPSTVQARTGKPSHSTVFYEAGKGVIASNESLEPGP